MRSFRKTTNWTWKIHFFSWSYTPSSRICIHVKNKQSKDKNSKSLLKTHKSDNNTYSESETEEETEDYENGNDSNNSSDNSTQTNGIQKSEEESYGIQFEPVGERAYMRKIRGIGDRHR